MATDLARIETVIVVMMENRSFDHALGYLSRSGGRADVDGIKDDAWCMSQRNEGRDGAYPPYRLARLDIPDPPHDLEAIRRQLTPPPGRAEWMRGFVQSYARRRPAPDDESLVMGFYEAPDVWMLDFFAREFAICDRWFSALPTGTQPNRLMAMAGTTRRPDNAPFLLDDHRLVYDWLDDRDIPWRVYHAGSLPFFALMPRWQGVMASDLLCDALGFDARFRRFEHFDRDVASDPTLPRVLFIEPEYTDGPHWSANDDHPPTSIAKGQAFLASIYRSLVQRPDRWAGTVMIVTWDEHGGFFDHVRPLDLRTDPPDGASYAPFVTTGARVPAAIVSPFVEPGAVFHEPLDHTCLLAFIAELFAPDAPYSDAVARRSPPLSRLANALTWTEPRDDMPAPPPSVPTAPAPPPFMMDDRSPGGGDDNAVALRAATAHMIANHPESAPALLPDAAHAVEAP